MNHAALVTQKNKRLSFIAGVVALVIGITAEFLLTSGQVILAAILFAIAAVLAVISLRRQTGPKIEVANPPETVERTGNKWGYICSGLAVLAAIVAFWLFTTPIPTVYPWLLHILSIGLFVISIFWIDGFRKKTAGDPQPWNWVEITVFLLILAAAAFLRLYRIDQFPFGTWYDEADYGLNALRILNEPGYFPVYVESTMLPAHLIYLIALSFKILGVSTLSIRAISVFFGVATVAVGYFTGRELFDRRMGLILAFLLAICRWDINWSRIGMHGITMPFFELLTIGLLLRALRRQHFIDYALAGISLGIGLAFYFAFRLFPVVLGLSFLVLLLARHDLFKSSWRGIVVFSLGVFIASVPITQLAVHQPDAFWARTNETSIFKDKTPEEGWKAVLQTTKDHLLMFNYQGDRNGRHNLPGEPMLDPITGALLVLGLGLCLWRIRQPGSFLLLAWFLIMLAPGIFSLDFESPQSYRAIGSLPAVCLMAGVPIYALWQAWDNLQEKRRSFAFLVPLALILGAAGFINYDVYFNRQAKSFDSWMVFSTPETIAGKIMAELGNQADYYVSTFYYQAPTVRFLAPAVSDYHRLETYESLPIASEGKKGIVIILDGDRTTVFQQAKRYYPQATFKEFKAPNGNTVVYEVYLKPADIAAVQGLTASYYPNANYSEKPVLVRKEGSLNASWKDGDPLAFPYGVEWYGILNAPTYGLYRLIARSPAKIELSIDGVSIDLKGPVEPTGEVLLAKGNHNIRIRAQAKDGKFELDWQTPGQQPGPIPASALYTAPITNNGLLGQYFSNGNWEGAPAFAQIDPWIHFYFHNPPLTRPYTVVWEGKIRISTGGHYRFGLESIDESSLFIDGKLLIDDRILNQYQEAEIDLDPGLHPIQIHFADRTGSTHIHLYWTPPGSDQEIVPQSVLFPPQEDPELLKTDGKIVMIESPSVANQQAPSEGAISLPSQSVDVLWQTGACGAGSGQFRDPHGIRLDDQGNLWVADTGNQRIVKLNPSGQVEFMFGSSGTGNGQFLQPFDLVIEKNKDLVILDAESPNILQRFSPDGKFQSAFATGLGAYHPRGLGIAPDGNLLLVDTGGSRLFWISPNETVVKQAGKSSASSGPNQPVSVAAAADGTIYLIEPASGLVWKLSPDGKQQNWPAVSPTDTLDTPRITIGPDQNIYITDPEKKSINVYTPDGKPLGQWMLEAGSPNLVTRPIGIAMDANGLLYISDIGQCRITALKLPSDIKK